MPSEKEKIFELDGTTEAVTKEEIEDEEPMRQEIKNLINYLNENPEKTTSLMLGLNCEMNNQYAFFICFIQNKIIIKKSGKKAGSVMLSPKERKQFEKIHSTVSKVSLEKRNKEKLSLIQEILDETNETK